jgi:B12-binding domain/radical SAM domain protein of rhizo-twelve system
MGECEETIAGLADGGRDDLPGIGFRDGGAIRVNGGPQAASFVDAAPLAWPGELVRRHQAHHHRFDSAPTGPGAEVEASRGCPFHCSFCAKELFRDRYRRRDLGALLAEIDGLIEQGVEYLYFIDEIFLPHRALLEALVRREVAFGVQTRIDLWKPAMIELLGEAGCVSIEAGVESLTPEGRDALDKDCRIDTAELTDRLILARRRVPFVQANLIETVADDPVVIARWREAMQAHGIWANDPVPLFPYPGSPDYRKLWGAPDDAAWERAHEHYLRQFEVFSEIQDERPRPLAELEERAA